MRYFRALSGTGAAMSRIIYFVGEPIQQNNLQISKSPNPGFGAFYPLDPGSGIDFFRIPDLFDYDQDFAPESIRSKKKSNFAFHFSCRIRDLG
jgi:hypothetical protein